MLWNVPKSYEVSLGGIAPSIRQYTYSFTGQRPTSELLSCSWGPGICLSTDFLKSSKDFLPSRYCASSAAWLSWACQWQVTFQTGAWLGTILPKEKVNNNPSPGQSCVCSFQVLRLSLWVVAAFLASQPLVVKLLQHVVTGIDVCTALPVYYWLLLWHILTLTKLIC